MEMETKNSMPTKAKPLEINGRVMEIRGTGIQEKNGTPLHRGMMMAYNKAVHNRPTRLRTKRVLMRTPSPLR